MKIFKDEDGNNYVVDKKGQKIKVEYSKSGKPYYSEKNRYVVMLRKED